MTETAIEELRPLLLDGDRPAAIKLALSYIEQPENSITGFYLQVLVPLMQRIGSEWSEGVLPVWREHIASAVARSVVEAVSAQTLPRTMTAYDESPGTAPIDVLLACPPEEAHDLGPRMLYDLFLTRGEKAVFLGADVPAAEIIAAASELGAKRVLLSASTTWHRVNLRNLVEQLTTALPETEIMVTGAAFTDRTEPLAEVTTFDPFKYFSDPQGARDA